ncbi:glucosamine-6-phosphate deaminase [Bacillus tuaregi]|uniref:glucosamine-6-phosphate deaminase n=1 Tax=Bacillus tuaregi TaxID=1816695 RepID=UPI0008F93480|nr:glucosamine-6-phosphate deaminase [Bacillus tuaregi]
MKIIEAKDYQELSQIAASYIMEQVKQKPESVLGLATGGTMLGTYQALIEDYRKNGGDYQHVQTFNLDEYVGLAKSDENSYHHYMWEQLFSHINVAEDRAHLPNGKADDMEKECLEYERLIKESGGIDLQLLGIGQNGHIGFNEPGSAFDSITRMVPLKESTRQANARYFPTLEDVPTHAITMGISTIMKSKKIVLLASGSQKADILYDLYHSDITADIPATILRNHPDTTIIADWDALAKIRQAVG